METGILPPFYAAQVSDRISESEGLRQMFIAFNGLKGEIKKDGDQWCAITGQMPENYIAGFAESQYQALATWWTAFILQKPSNESSPVKNQNS